MQYKQLQITKFPQSGFLLIWQEKNIYIDPFMLQDGQPLADYIFVTHEHQDHLDETSIRKILTPETVIYGNELVREKLPDDLSGEINRITPGTKETFTDFTIEAVPAYNLNKFREPGVPFHPKENLGVGIVFRFLDSDGNDEITFYHMGDTDFHDEIPKIPMDILAIPVSGTYVMTVEEAIEAIQILKPKIVIPMHYGVVVGSRLDAQKVKDNVDSETWIID